MNLFKNRKLYILITCVIVISTVGFFVYKSFYAKQVIVRQKCPEYYAEDDTGKAEYRYAMTEWTAEYFKTHSEATMSDWSKAKAKLWKDNNCTVAIERLKMSGRVEDLKPYELVDIAMQDAIVSVLSGVLHYDASELGFSFNYSNDMYVMSDTEDPRLYIIPDDGSEPITAVVISAMLNDPQMTPLEWLNGPYSGADMSKGYSKLTIDGQEAISMNDGIWIVVNTPNNKRQLSVATLPLENPSESLKAEMNNIVNSIIFNR
jgi:hypothetical protein